MKSVVFDFGGVLFRWRPAALVRQVMPRRAPDDASARAWAARLFGDAWCEFDRGSRDAAETARAVAAAADLDVAEVGALIDAVPAELVILPHSVALLETLHAHGHPLFFLSNMPEPFTHHVQRAPFFARFRDGVFSSQVHLIKPEREIFEAAERRFGVEAADLVFIDDMPANVDAARAHGWQAVRFVDAVQCERDLRSLGCLA